MSTVYPSTLSGIRHWAIADWQASGIDPVMIAANLQIFEGIAALDRVLYSPKLRRTQSGGNPVAPAEQKPYRFLEDGIWRCKNLAPSSAWEQESLWSQVKPLHPRPSWKKLEDDSWVAVPGKFNKYESPKHESYGVYYLDVPEQIAAQVSARCGVPYPGGNFWQWVRDNISIPLILPEGAKKDAACLSRGHAAIGLGGVWMFRDPSDKDKLHPDLLAIRLKGRRIHIGFDFDPKLKTQIAVGKASNTLAYLLRKEGAIVDFIRIPSPDGEKCGLDDYFVQTGDDDLEGCEFSSESLYPYNPWEFTYEPDILVNRRYLGDIEGLPYSGLRIVKATTGTGKTDHIRDQMVPLIEQGSRCLIITNRKSTGRELAARFGVQYIDDGEGVRDSVYGFACCVESVKPFGKASPQVTRVRQTELGPEKLPSEWLDGIVILDEFDQTLQQMLGGSTCRGDRGWIITTFKSLIQDVLVRSNGLVVAISADISNLDVEFLMAIAREACDDEDALQCPIRPFVVVNEFEHEHKYNAYLYNGPADIYNKAVEILKSKPQDKCLWFSVEGAQTKSKWGTKTIERMLKEEFPGIRIKRFDQQILGTDNSDADIEHINELARDCDVMLSSTSISSAVSLHETERWIAVCDISAGLNSVREYRQRLDRVRAGVDRHLFIPKIAKPIANGSSDYRKIRAGKNRQVSALMRILQEVDFNIDKAHDPVCFRTWTKQVARFNRDCYRYREAAISLFESEGVRVIPVDSLDKEGAKAISNSAKMARDKNWADHCIQRADALEIEPETFRELDKKAQKTEAEQYQCERYRIAQDFGGIEELTPSLIKKHDESRHKQWRLNFYLLFAKFAESQDRRDLEHLLSRPLLHLPDIQCRSVKARMLEFLGVKRLLDPDKEFTGESPEVQGIVTLARSGRQSVKDCLGVKINPGVSAMQTCQQLLGLMDLKLTSSRRRTPEGVKRFYRFIPPEDERWAVFDLWVDGEVLKSSDSQGGDPAGGDPAASDPVPPDLTSGEEWGRSTPPINRFIYAGGGSVGGGSGSRDQSPRKEREGINSPSGDQPEESRAIASDGEKPINSPSGDQPEESRAIASTRQNPTNSPSGDQPEESRAIASTRQNPINVAAGEQPFEGINSPSDSSGGDQPEDDINSATNSPAGDRTNADILPRRFVTGDRIRGIYHNAYGGTEQREGIVEVDPLGRLYFTLEKKAKFDVTPKVLLDSLQDIRPLPDPVVTRETTELIEQLTHQGTGLGAIRELIVGRYGVPDRRLMSTSQLRDLRDRLLSLLAKRTEQDSCHQKPGGHCGPD
ncbi:plasmid replication protein, CyRepA1 family [Laspinema olomoucense]|uniref:plasmid replication protein, CyRepA1 family n=1 Tax=Laspinema olomoucense TaxID=3231600 RepID=UPI0021BA8DF5|nr:plasmid replication protein, CyRepA1 family [Laspinema sp. D3d]MCT7975890.1 DUF3854 domain-containing protein [Laspinema sp. D3d]